MGIFKDILGVFSKKIRTQNEIDRLTKLIAKLDAKISRGGAPATIVRMRAQRADLVAERAALIASLG